MLEIINLSKEFLDKTSAVFNLNLTIVEGEFFSLLGPSGCGKTTLLRMIAGLETPTRGEIRLDQTRIDQLPPQQRPFNLVFQRYALFPHLSVSDNIAFGLAIKKLSKSEIHTRVTEALALVNMSDFKDRMPETLSGGQAQRVALARALVNRPKVLLLDEPLSALDLKLREHMQIELKALQKKLGLTFIYVTHDQEEAFALSDRIAVMNAGKIEQVADALSLYRAPASQFVANFVGQTNKIFGEIKDLKGPVASVKTSFHDLKVHLHSSCTQSVGSSIVVMIRPENLSLHAGSDSVNSSNVMQAVVVNQIFRGDCIEWLLKISENQIISAMSFLDKMQTPSFKINEVVKVSFSPEEAIAFSR